MAAWVTMLPLKYKADAAKAAPALAFFIVISADDMFLVA